MLIKVFGYLFTLVVLVYLVVFQNSWFLPVVIAFYNALDRGLTGVAPCKGLMDMSVVIYCPP